MDILLCLFSTFRGAELEISVFCSNQNLFEVFVVMTAKEFVVELGLDGVSWFLKVLSLGVGPVLVVLWSASNEMLFI